MKPEDAPVVDANFMHDVKTGKSATGILHKLVLNR
jgi:hypothetical protein